MKNPIITLLLLLSALPLRGQGPDNRLIHGLVTRVLWVSPNQLKALSVGTFVYAGLLLTEGTGLLLRRM